MNCSSLDTILILVEECEGIADISDFEFMMFHNPSNEMIYIESPDIIQNIKIFNRSGIIMKSNMGNSKYYEFYASLLEKVFILFS